MKTCRSFALAFIGLFCAVTISGQTADEIIGKYVQAIGGKDVLNNITSVYYESTFDAMGTQGPVKMTTLNGKGMKQEVDIMGSLMITCYTDKGGWSTNPMAGGTTPEDMTEAQYNAGKDQIVIGAPFVNFAESGYKAELSGTEAVGDINAYKIKLTAPDSTTSLYFFDPNTFYLVKSVQESEMQGQIVETIMIFSDYKQTEGYAMPYKMDMDMGGGQFTVIMTVNKVELNVPVNDSIFIKPQ
jgi:hypothetical protein